MKWFKGKKQKRKLNVTYSGESKKEISEMVGELVDSLNSAQKKDLEDEEKDK